MSGNYKLDEKGNVITYPLTGFKVVPVAGVAAMTILHYVESEDQLKKGESESIQLILTPQQCLEVGDQLKRTADRLLGNVSTDIPN